MNIVHPESLQHISNTSQKKYTVYKTRWVILAVCFIVTLTNTTMWLGLSAVSTQADLYYCGVKSKCEVAFMANQIFQLLAIVFGLPGMFLTDKFGIRPSLYAAVLFNLVGSCIRTLSSSPHIDDKSVKQSLLYGGTAIVATAQSFFLVLPTKIAEGWFCDKQRSIANVILFIAHPIGAALGMILPVMYFDTSKKMLANKGKIKNNNDFFTFNLGLSIVASIALILILFVSTNLPKTPPSSAAEARGKHSMSFSKSIAKCLKNIEFIKLLLVGGTIYGLLWTFVLLFPTIMVKGKILSPGLISAIFLLVGTFSSLFMGDLVDRTKKFLGILQMLLLAGLISLIVIRLLLIYMKWNRIYDDVIITVLVCVYSCCALPQIPVTFELAVEITFPVYEATATGILVIAGNIILLCLYAVVEMLQRTKLIYKQTKRNPDNWQLALDFLIVLSFLPNIMAYFFMKPKYQRMNAEQEQENRLFDKVTQEKY